MSDPARKVGSLEEERPLTLIEFEFAVGRSARKIRELHELISDDTFLPRRAEDGWKDSVEFESCSWCGATACVIHMDGETASNIRTALSWRARDLEHRIPSCGRECFLDVGQPRKDLRLTPMEVIELEKLRAKWPRATSCHLAYLLKKPCYLINEHHPPPPSRIPRHVKAPAKRAQDHLAQNSYGHLPCAHDGPCAPCIPACAPKHNCQLPTHCICTGNKTLCDHYCGCSDLCDSRWKGCNCLPGKEDACVACPCAQVYRECDPLVCRCLAEKCHNGRIRRQESIKTYLAKFKVENGGWGLFIGENAGANAFVGLYGGESFGGNDFYGQLNDLFLEAESKISYVYITDQHHAIDSQVFGNSQRYINSDPNPNCVARPTYIDGTHQMALYTLRALQAGDELYLDYGKAYF